MRDKLKDNESTETIMFFGIGFTSIVYGVNSFTLFTGDRLTVFNFKKLKVYHYDKQSHKPVIKMFLGFTKGDIVPSSEDQSIYGC